MPYESIVLTDFDKFLRNLFTICVAPTIATGASYTLINGLPGFYTYITFLAYQQDVAALVTVEEENGHDLMVFQANANVFLNFNYGLLPMRVSEKGSNVMVKHGSIGSENARITVIGFYDDTQF